MQRCESPQATLTLSVIFSLSLCPVAICSAASKVYMTPEGWTANELLMKREPLTQRDFNDGSVKDKEEVEQLCLLWETNHHTHGLLKTEDDFTVELKTILREHKSMKHTQLKICAWPAFEALLCSKTLKQLISTFFLTSTSLSWEYVRVHYPKEQSRQLIDGCKVFCKV